MQLNSNITTVTPLNLVLKSQAMLKQRTKESIVFAKPILMFNGLGFIYQNSINVVQGKSGVHKSRLVESICACLLAKPEAEPGNYIGITKTNRNKNVRLIYVDTERNEREQFPFAIQQIKKMAGYEIKDDVPNFEYFSFIQVSRAYRHEALQEYLSLESEADPNAETFVILDVITDCLGNFNDPRDATGLVDFLNQQISEQNVTFICVFHENPGGDKARGHVGTELMNKASTQMQIAFDKDSKGKDTDLIVVNILKNRSQAKGQPAYLLFDADKRALVLADDEKVQQGIDSKRTKLSSMELLEYLSQELKAPTSNTEVITMIMEHFKCSRTTAQDRLKDVVELSDKELISANIKGPVLVKESVGKKVLYSIKNSLDG